MKRNMYAVITREVGRVHGEEYDLKSGNMKSFSRKIYEDRITLCESAEEAKDFIKEIKTRKHPYVVNYRYGGLLHNVL